MLAYIIAASLRGPVNREPYVQIPALVSISCLNPLVIGYQDFRHRFASMIASLLEVTPYNQFVTRSERREPLVGRPCRVSSFEREASHNDVVRDERSTTLRAIDPNLQVFVREEQTPVECTSSSIQSESCSFFVPLFFFLF